MKLLRQFWFWYIWVGLIILSLIWASYRFNWLSTGFQSKTVWDWLQLLIIPLALALVALLFNQVNTRTERQIAEQHYGQEKQIALDKQREDLLQVYLDRMSELLLDKGLRNSQFDAEVRKVARIRTISILIQLDVRRVGYVFTFLREAGLTDAKDPIVDLSGANLAGVNWSQANLRGANLSRFHLNGANLSGANLRGARLVEALLRDANLQGAMLRGANLQHAQLDKANLSDADLGPNCFPGDLGPDSPREADLSGAFLIGVNFSGTKLFKTKLINAEIDKSQLTLNQITQVIW